MILGIGTDIVDCTRIAKVLERKGELFTSHLLTEKEQTQSRNDLYYICGRWAAKEAFSKALGCGIGAQCSFQDIQILRDPSSGRPLLSVHGKAAETAAALGAKHFHVSISHEKTHAVATVIIED